MVFPISIAESTTAGFRRHIKKNSINPRKLLMVFPMSIAESTTVGFRRHFKKVQ